MDNKQKRKLLILIYRTIFLFAFLALATTTYFCIDKLVFKTETSVLWLDITILCYVFFILCFMIADNIATRRMSNKYRIAKFYYLVFVTSFIALVVIGILVYAQKINILNYISYILPIGLLFLTEIVLLVNFTLGLTLSKLHKSTTVTIDSSSETPTFDDEVILKKRFDELNRKLEMKKVQEKIENIEKELNE